MQIKQVIRFTFRSILKTGRISMRILLLFACFKIFSIGTFARSSISEAASQSLAA
jgi:hypothetical protein